MSAELTELEAWKKSCYDIKKAMGSNSKNPEDLSKYIENLRECFNKQVPCTDTEKFIELIMILSRYYSPASEFSHHYLSDSLNEVLNKKMTKLAKGFKINKKVYAIGYHCGYVSLKGRVSVMDILDNSIHFICEGFDLHRGIQDVKLRSEDDDSFTILVTVDNFSS